MSAHGYGVRGRAAAEGRSASASLHRLVCVPSLWSLSTSGTIHRELNVQYERPRLPLGTHPGSTGAPPSPADHLVDVHTRVCSGQWVCWGIDGALVGQLNKLKEHDSACCKRKNDPHARRLKLIPVSACARPRLYSIQLAPSSRWWFEVRNAPASDLFVQSVSCTRLRAHSVARWTKA